MSLQGVENLLTETYLRQAANYARAVSVADGLFANWNTVVDVVSAMQPIGVIMDEIRHNNQALGKHRQQWLEAGQKPGAELAAALQQCAGLIERLRVRIGELEQLAVDRKQSMAPELDKFSRVWQMQKAYAGAGRMLG